MKVKNNYPTNINRNNYVVNRKKSTIETPSWLSDYIFNIVDKKLKVKKICDVGCYNGNLSAPFHAAGYECTGYDTQNKNKKYPGIFHKLDFLNTEFNLLNFQKDTAVIMNPPFNDEEGIYGRKLAPELFIKKVFEVFGEKVPFITFVPMGLLANQRISSDRWKFLRDSKAEITSRLVLPIDCFIKNGNEQKYNSKMKELNKELKEKKIKPDEHKMIENQLKDKYGIVLVHSEVLFFNIRGLKPVYFLDI
jgi:predicted RNA methylase